MSGVTIKRVTAHNARFVFDNKIGPGSVITLVRSGQVIPKVENVLLPSASGKPQMPDESWGWNANGVEAVQKTVGNVKSSATKAKAITHFFKAGLAVDDLGLGVVQQLYDAGYDTVGKIIKLRVKDLLNLEGWQQRKAEKIYNNIQKACENADLIKVMAGSGILGPLLGERKLTSLFKQRPKLFDMSIEHTPRQIATQLQNVEGFKDKSAAPVIANLAKCFKFLQALPITFKKAETVKVVGKKMAGQAVCFTGVRSKPAELEIVKQGGTVVSGVSGKTTMLVAADPGESSLKLDKARSLGIKIVSLGQINKLLGIV